MEGHIGGRDLRQVAYAVLGLVGDDHGVARDADVTGAIPPEANGEPFTAMSEPSALT